MRDHYRIKVSLTMVHADSLRSEEELDFVSLPGIFNAKFALECYRNAKILISRLVEVHRAEEQKEKV